MLRELDHRVKNNLATILSMADQTARDTDSIQVFQESFSGRVNSMARAHELLAASKWEGVELQEAIRIVMAASRGADRTRMDGVDVMLPPDVATPTCLVLNELATNALKYGSLSVEAGCDAVSWGIYRGLGKALLYRGVLAWRFVAKGSCQSFQK